jgi:outer membrane protein
MKMRKIFSTALICTFILSAKGLFALDSKSLVGVVNFTSCLTDSKFGKQEQQNLENIRKQMSSIMEETEKELKDISSKLEDQEYLDGLSPKAEEELKVKYQSLNEDLMRYQNQFYQVLNQANYQIVQKLSSSISKASEKVAKEKNLSYVMNKDACFYYKPDLEVTTLVIQEMDKNFEIDLKSKKISENAEAPASLEAPKEAAR